jgi:argininosuccinate lyase
LIRECEQSQSDLHTLPLAAFASANALFTHDVFQVLSAQHSVEQREVDGGTGPGAVRIQLEAAQRALG